MCFQEATATAALVGSFQEEFEEEDKVSAAQQPLHSSLAVTSQQNQQNQQQGGLLLRVRPTALIPSTATLPNSSSSSSMAKQPTAHQKQRCRAPDQAVADAAAKLIKEFTAPPVNYGGGDAHVHNKGHMVSTSAHSGAQAFT
jgi:hypothetical protein